MADPRYAELLGIDASIEDPTYFDLLGVTRGDANDVIEKAFKERMTKLQQIKSPKHKGFIEYLKEEIRTAKLTLMNAEMRKQFEGKLHAHDVEEFKKFALPLMALGEVPKRVFDTILQTAQRKHNLGPEQARPIVEELAKQNGATLIMVEPQAAPLPPPASAPAPPRAAAPRAGGSASQDPGDMESSADLIDELFSDGSGGEGAAAPAPAEAAPTEEAPPTPSRINRSRGFHDDVAPAAAQAPAEEPGSTSRIRRGRGFHDDGGAPAAPAEEVVPPRIQRSRGFHDDGASHAPSTPTPAEGSAANVARRRSSFFSDELSPPSRPRGSDTAPGTKSERIPPRGDTAPGTRSERIAPGERAGGRKLSSSDDAHSAHGAGRPTPPPPAWAPDPARVRQPEPAAPAGEPQDPKLLEDARRAYNSAIKLSRLALQAHQELANYFPPGNKSNAATTRINGVSYEDLAKTESKMWKEAVPYFEKASLRVAQMHGGFADEIRDRAKKAAADVASYLEEWKKMNFKLMQGVSKAEELKLWQGYVSARRSHALAQELDKPREG